MAGVDGVITSGSATVDFASVAAGAAGTASTITVSGAKVGHLVVVNAADLEAGMILNAYVSAADTVTLVLNNTTAGAIDEASMTVYYSVIHG